MYSARAETAKAQHETAGISSKIKHVIALVNAKHRGVLLQVSRFPAGASFDEAAAVAVLGDDVARGDVGNALHGTIAGADVSLVNAALLRARNAACGGIRRYSMHPFVRDVAAELLARPESEGGAGVTDAQRWGFERRFFRHLATLGGELADACEAQPSQTLARLRDDGVNFAFMMRLAAVPGGVSAVDTDMAAALSVCSVVEHNRRIQPRRFAGCG